MAKKKTQRRKTRKVHRKKRGKGKCVACKWEKRSSSKGNCKRKLQQQQQQQQFTNNDNVRPITIIIIISINIIYKKNNKNNCILRAVLIYNKLFPFRPLALFPSLSLYLSLFLQHGTQPATNVYGNIARRKFGPDDNLPDERNGRQILLHSIVCKYRNTHNECHN